MGEGKGWVREGWEDTLTYRSQVQGSNTWWKCPPWLKRLSNVPLKRSYRGTLERNIALTLLGASQCSSGPFL